MDWGAPMKSVMKALDRYLTNNQMSALLYDTLVAFKAYCTEEADRLVSKILAQTVDHLESLLTEHR
jgi:hypothetical protein